MLYLILIFLKNSFDPMSCMFTLNKISQDLWAKTLVYFLIHHTAIFSVVIHTTASCDVILRRSPDVEFTSDSRTQLRDVIWIKYISTTTEEM